MFRINTFCYAKDFSSVYFKLSYFNLNFVAFEDNLKLVASLFDNVVRD